MTDQIEAKLHDLLVTARRMGATAAEARTNRGESNTVTVRGGRLETVVRSEPEAWTLKLWAGTRSASLSTTDLARSDALASLVDRTLTKARLAPSNPFAGLAGSNHIGSVSNEADAALELFDPIEIDLDCLKEMACEAEAAAMAVPKVSISDGASITSSRSTAYHLTSEGLSARSERTGFGLSASVVAGEAGGLEAEAYGRTTRWLRDLPTSASIGAEAGRRAAARVGARRIASAKVPVIFDRCVAMSVISPLLQAISGAAVARGSSFLKGKLGAMVFSPAVSILDDPTILRALGSRIVDGEGVPTLPRAFIDEGVLTSWMLDVSSARQLGLKPNGYGRAGTSNLTVRPGTRSPDDMMRTMGSGLLVTNMFGPSLNEETGDWSAGASGMWFENGEPAYPVNELTVAGSLPDIYARLEPADDLKIEGAANSPSLLVDALTVAGK